MTLFIRIICTMFLIAVGATSLFAGSVDYLSNQSAEYIRTFNRNAATDSADAVNYNPAGVVKMQDGLYVNAGNQFIFKTFSGEDKDATHIFNTEKYESTEPTLLVPNLYVLYRMQDWAAFCAFTVPGGGGKLIFDGGTPMLRTALYGVVALTTGDALQGVAAVQNIDKFEMSSMYLAGTLGGAYKINDMFSISLGIRYISAEKTYTAKAQTPNILYTASASDADIADVELTADGFSGIIGVNVTPMEKLNIGIRYETNTKLEWDTDVTASAVGTAVVTGLGYVDGETEKEDLPAIAALGVSYDVLPELKLSSDFTYYFIKQATWEHYDGTDTNDDYDNGWEAGISAEYLVMPQLLLSAGYVYTKIGSNDETWMDLEIALDGHAIGIGGRYEIMPGLDVNLAFGWAIYKDSSSKYLLGGTTEQDVDYKRDAKIVAIGVQYKAL